MADTRLQPTGRIALPTATATAPRKELQAAPLQGRRVYLKHFNGTMGVILKDYSKTNENKRVASFN